MAHSFAEWRQLSREDLIREYDRRAPRVEDVGIAYIRDEILRRDVEEQTDRMVQMTREVRTLTRWITVLTVINTGGVVAALLLEVLGRKG